MGGKFFMSMSAGVMLGVAASYAMLDYMRPDVTTKLMRNGKRVMHRYMSAYK